MGELKPGEKRVKFGDVVRQVKDKVKPEDSGLQRYVAGEHMESDDLRIWRWPPSLRAAAPAHGGRPARSAGGVERMPAPPAAPSDAAPDQVPAVST